MKLPRFYPILDTATLQRCGLDAIDAAEALLAAGARIVQLRHKGHFDRETYAKAQQIASLAPGADVLLVINDRVDVAMLLKQQSMLDRTTFRRRTPADSPATARILGFSTHNEKQLKAAATEPIDYVALGPIFGTISKQNPDPQVGVAELRRLKPLARVPLVAIGGITRATAPEVWAAGADSIAVVGDLYPDVRRSAEEWLKLS